MIGSEEKKQQKKTDEPPPLLLRNIFTHTKTVPQAEYFYERVNILYTKKSNIYKKEMPNTKGEVYKDKAGQFRARVLSAANSKVIASTEGYKTKAAAMKALELCAVEKEKIADLTKGVPATKTPAKKAVQK